jgi:succinate-acetate transporter protein
LDISIKRVTTFHQELTTTVSGYAGFIFPAAAVLTAACAIVMNPQAKRKLSSVSL